MKLGVKYVMMFVEEIFITVHKWESPRYFFTEGYMNSFSCILVTNCHLVIVYNFMYINPIDIMLSKTAKNRDIICVAF